MVERGWASEEWKACCFHKTDKQRYIRKQIPPAHVFRKIYCIYKLFLDLLAFGSGNYKRSYIQLHLWFNYISNLRDHHHHDCKNCAIRIKKWSNMVSASPGKPPKYHSKWGQSILDLLSLWGRNRVWDMFELEK